MISSQETLTTRPRGWSRNIKSALSYGNEFLVVYFLQTIRSPYSTLSDLLNTVLFFCVTNSVATAAMPLFPLHTHSHVQLATSLHCSSPFPRDDRSAPIPSRHTTRTTFSTRQLILPSWSWKQHTNLKRRCATYWSICDKGKAIPGQALRAPGSLTVWRRNYFLTWICLIGWHSVKRLRN